MLRICVDSNSQLPTVLARRFGIVSVPVIVRVDGTEYREGVDLDADRFYEFWADGHIPEVTTSQPAPGDFLHAFEQMAGDGATEIVSIHVGEAFSGTLDSVRLAAVESPVPVHVVDTGTASFGISCCAWAAAEAIADGSDAAAAAAVAAARAAALATVFVVGVPSLTERGGRAAGVGVAAAGNEGIPLLRMDEHGLAVAATVRSVNEAVAAMADYALGRRPSMPGGLRIAIGTSDVSSRPVAEALTEILGASGDVADVVQYRIGPSVGAHTGPGTAGLFVF